MVLLLLLSLLSMVLMLVLADMLPTLPVLFMLPSVRLKLNQKLMLSMELMAMVDMVLDTVLTLLDMVLDMATLLLAMVMVWDMPGMDMASVLPMLSQRLMLMLSMELMVDTVLDTALTLLDMVDMAWDTILMVLDMVTLPLVMVMAMDVDMASTDKQQVTSQRPSFQLLRTFQGVKNPCQ